MAHRAHRIPWRSLTSQLIHRAPTHTSPDTTIANLFFRFIPTQAQDLGHFATSFARALNEDTTAARQQYAPKYLPPARDELLLNDRLAARIHPLTFSWHYPERDNVQKTQQLCQHIDSTTDFACGCPLPYTERRAAAFLRPYQWNYCFQFAEVNGDGFFNLQVVSTLLVLGEMEILFRLCAHPDIGLKEWMRVQDCRCVELCEIDHGWGPVFDAALEMYLTLNTLYCFPELNSSSSSASKHADGNKSYAHDYRTTRMCQRPVDKWTDLWQTTEMSRYPHRQFLGLEPQSGFASQDTARVEAYLRERGVPDDWVAEMTTLSDEGNKEPRSRLLVPHDPLHERNCRQLRRYLHRCWQIMVRCNMLARELGAEINWAWEVVKALEKLVSCPPGLKLYQHRNDYPESFDVYTLQGGSEELSYAIRVRREE
ncbi:hypothetical protein ASPACDRAFT_50713 [Aspergillus aculeatus ATCC 16872]|uniref:Uncharacterized protein n=1 Tax=Aspergillus aculeatus (strain ATCC 16872 / CBS 172.66 / WB 5094) TaxID=690307 RepID=A0A1L9X061_ASPA1|nr:uncharacterized protein ASPACDRAFT_50713 [Aspergillus aculeatus ATCC 16872]OJK01905.1 hypothetical protein ASPACDRAFT_50713 [Aspergillus aculeatus ATCC 16872]